MRDAIAHGTRSGGLRAWRDRHSGLIAHAGLVQWRRYELGECKPMTDDKEPNEHALSKRWPTLAPEVKRAFQQSLAEWLAKEYGPPAETSAELRALLKRMEGSETE